MRRFLVAIACAAVAAVVSDQRSAAAAGADGNAAADSVRLLQVPYVPQSEALCGGAALAMVLRYWGEPAVLAEDFAALLEPGRAGIPTGALVEAVRARGWMALPLTGSPELARRQIAEGRPLIALIGRGSGVFHYVVIVACANGGVIVHDPAVGPYRVMRAREFDTAWTRGGHWALLIQPPAESTPRAAPPTGSLVGADSTAPSGEDGCDAIVETGIRKARGGDPGAAELRFRAAEALCPRSAAPLRELAGLRFAAEDWRGAAGLAERALALEPTDALTWRLLAGSRFLAGDTQGALAAWNRLGEPRTDLTHVDGLVRTRYRAVADQLDLAPHRVITSGAFLRARRRLAELPTLRDARLSVQPLAAGAAQVNVALLERPLLFDGPLAFGGAALGSLVNREVSLDVAGPTGNGELWSAAWRWWAERPRVALALSVPAAGGRPGLWRVDGVWERQAYAARSASGVGPDSDVIRERRRRTALSYADWVGPNLRVETRVALDRWDGRSAFGALEAACEARAARDHFVFQAELAGWAGQGAPFRSAGVLAMWASQEFPRGAWRAHVGAEGVSERSPLALWPGAGTGQGRPALLRAHPLLEGGILNGAVFGRTLLHGGLERRQWPWSLGPLRFGWAVFVDAARPWNTLSSGPQPWRLDGGAGLRVGGVGRRGQLRLDVARGLSDGATAVSAAWELR